MERARAQLPEDQRLLNLANRVSLKDEDDKSLSKKQLYNKVQAQFMIPSFKSRCMTIPYLKSVMLVPRCFKLSQEDWRNFLAANGRQ